MRKDYHMHPTVLQKPEKFELFAQQALERGIGEICVTDHMPLSVSSASDRIPKGEVAAYCRRVREIAKRYEGVLTVKCGIEIDYHPSVTDEIERVLADGEFDYIIASSHMHIFVKDYAKYTYNDFAQMALENSVMAVESGLFDAVAHPDMYRFAFEDAVRFPLIKEAYSPERHEQTLRELFSKMAGNGMYLEINPHLAESKNDLSFVYPAEQMLHWACELGVRFSYGSDAHRPTSVGCFLEELETHAVYGQALRAWERMPYTKTGRG